MFLRIAKRYLGIEDAADVLQDTILIVFEEIGNWKQPQYFHTWITKY
ncbi:sigma factor [Enterococcus mundtii]